MSSARRQFLRQLAALSVLPSLPALAAGVPLQRRYGSTDLRLPVIGLGTWQQLDHAADSAGYREARGALYAFLDGGGRVIDSSPMYGRAEARLGDALADVPAPERAFVATKIWTRGEAAGRAQLAHSQRLIRRPLDLVQVHNLQDLATHLKTLRAAKDAGTVGSIGVTHYLTSAHAELQRVITRERPDALQINYSLGEPEAGDRLLRAAAELGIAVLINRPFASGQLFGAVRGRELPPVAAELGCSSWAQLFLKWILADQAVTCVLIGTSNPAHVADNLGAASGPLPDREQREAIRQAWLGAS